MDENAFDVTIVGTGLTESIAAAALSKAGLRVLHIDTDANYGSSDASLTLIDLHHLLLSPPPYLADISAPVAIPEALLRESRNYAISLAPSVVPSVGPVIDALVKSGVSRYVKFKLLDGVGLYAQSSHLAEDLDGETMDEPIGIVKTVPGSKEDVFKSKDLGLLQKRKLMKFLMATASPTASSSSSNSHSNTMPFLEYLRSKEVGLEPDVANAVAYALSLSSNPNETTGEAIKRLQKYIRSTGRHGNSPFLVGHFGGAGEIAQGFCRAAAVAGATYILGRPFTISQATNITTTEPQSPPPHNFQLSLEGIDDILTSRCLVSRQSSLPPGLLQEGHTTMAPTRRLARCIAVIDGPVYFARPPSIETEDQTRVILDDEDEDVGKGIVDSAILVFPPGSLGPTTDLAESFAEGVVTAFIAGPNALACPDGKRTIYLSTEIPVNTSPETTLQPYLSAMQHLNRPQNDPSTVLMSLFYTQAIQTPRAPPHEVQTQTVSLMTASAPEQLPGITVASLAPGGLEPLHPPTDHLAELGDEAAEEAQRVFWAVIERLGLDGRVQIQAQSGELDLGTSSQQSVVAERLEAEAGVDRGDVGRAERGTGQGDVGDVDAEYNGEEMEKVTVMWPRLLVDESGGDSW